MAYQIRISPDALRNGAARYHDTEHKFMDIMANLDTVIDSLKGVWEGRGSTSAIFALNKIMRGVQQFSVEIHKAADALERIASAFESLDSEGGAISGIALVIDFSELHKLVGASAQLALFSTGEIRIVVDEVRNYAQLCLKTSEEILATIDESSEILNTLLETWEGNSRRRFEENMVELRPAGITLSEELREIAAAIMHAADRYEELDNSL